MRHLRLRYFACEDAESIRELVAKWNAKKTWNEIINSNLSEKFRFCPRFLYLSYFDVKEVEKAGFFDFVKTELSSWYGDDGTNPNMVQFFCDLEDTILIPMTELANLCVPIAVEKPKSEDMIIPIEVIKWFEEQHPMEKRGNVISLVERQEKRGEQEDSDNPSETIDDIGFEPPPITDPYLTKKEVAKLIGFSTSSIDKWGKEGKFPVPVKFGEKNVRWRTSAVVLWMEEREKEDKQKRRITDPPTDEGKHRENE